MQKKGDGLQFNEAQKRAIRHADGPCLVLAGPGSGKTAVITERAAYLIRERGVKPESILTLTFTKPAAQEMQQRFLKITESAFPETVFGTFHAAFYRMLVSVPSLPRPHFLTAHEKSRLMEQVLRTLKLPYNAELTATLLSFVSAKKNGAAVREHELPFPERFPEIFGAYEALRAELNGMDFDDVAPACLKAMRTHPQVLAEWRRRFSYLQVDEAQDINPVQYGMVRLLAGERNNLLMVGDDDQSVYGFRGASPRILRRFLSDCPLAVQTQLTVNYRSHPAIIALAGRMIAGNAERFPKRIRASEAPPGKGDKSAGVCCRIYPDRKEEIQAIVSYLEHRYAAKGNTLADTALLVRTGAEALPLLLALQKARIPCFLREKTRNLYTEPAVQDLLAYLRFACGAKRTDFLRILNKPLRCLSRSCASDERIDEEKALAYYSGNPQAQRTLRQFFRSIGTIRSLRPQLALRYVRRGIGYDRHLRAARDAERFRIDERLLDGIEEEAADFSDLGSFLAHIEENSACFRAASVPSDAARFRGVRLMTMHAAKGLEFDTVLLPFLNRGVMPSARAVTEEALEEERRILYVAITRAARRLMLSCAARDGRKELLPTPFIRFPREQTHTGCRAGEIVLQ